MSKKSLIDSIEVKTPCSEDWDKMKGTDKIRFCEHCSFEVNNISQMTRKQAMRLVRDSKGRICVRYVKNPINNKPIFSDRLYRITRRAGITAGVLGASLTLSTLAYAQGETGGRIGDNKSENVEVVQESQSKEEKTEGAAASLSGTITDPNGAVVPNVTVTLISLQTNETRTAVSNEEGAYRFENVPAGLYKINISATYGFADKEITDINVSDGNNVSKDISMNVGMEVAVMGVMVSSNFRSPLSRAVSDNDLEEVRNLIARGENVNGKDEDYNNITPLFLAVENGSAEIAATLLNFGAKINARDGNKQTPLMRLDEDATPELVRLLINHGAKINLIDANGDTALILAANSVKAEVLQILLDHGAGVNAQNKSGQTALMNAADADSFESVRALILAGANVNLKNKEGETAWDLTANSSIEDLLESHGAVIEEN
ncbi:MAG TPA: ankyrin repeat domain-containing protein [Pyrinomonadaceae bacterium]|jgi:ankyrin repeat protein